MSSSNLILPKTERFAANLLHHEEKSLYLPENLPNFTNHLVSNMEYGKETLTLK